MTVKKPVILNLYKHHKGFINSCIDKTKNMSSFSWLIEQLKIIGNSQMDIYYGNLSPLHLSLFSIEYLKNIGYFEKVKYIKWLDQEGKGYKLAQFPDHSTWTFRYGSNMPGCYIHIHPARYSYLTGRVKASGLKTAIAYLAFKKFNHVDFSINDINHIRVNYLNLSPLKSLDKTGEISQCINI